MRRSFFILLIVSSLSLSSCTSADNIVASYPFLDKEGEDDPAVPLLFSNETNVQGENNYYDALIDVQQKYPDKLSGVNVLTEEDQELIDYYEIDDFPTLLLVEELEVILRIEGIHDISSIYDEIVITLLDEEEIEHVS